MGTRLKILLAVALVVIAAGGAGAYWYFRDDAPPEVSLAAATASVGSSTASTPSTTGATGSAGGTGIEGTLVVDSATGDFDYESATGTFAGFRIQEELANIGSATAVGRTGDVTGTVQIDGTTVSSATFEIDLTTITTNESRRDDKVQEALETSRHPTATFALAEPIELGPNAADGEALAVTAVGDLTIKGVTQRVEFPLEAQLVDDTVVVVGSLDLTFSDYGVEVPESQLVLSVEDHGILELQVLLVEG